MRHFLENKVVIITGASSGIGMACARVMALKGASVVLAARRINRLNALREEILHLGRRAIAIQTDVSQEQDCRKLVETTVKEFGRIDVLINNAGISMRALFIDLSPDILHRVMNVNFWGTVYCTRYALPHLLASKGSLVAVSSIAGFKGLPARTGYSASKFAINGLMETIRIEYLRSGLHVMVVAPSFTRSEIREHALLYDGSTQGDSPRNENHMISPEWVARRIYWGLKMRKRNIILGLKGQLLILLQRILPKTIDWLEYREMANENGSPLKH